MPLLFSGTKSAPWVGLSECRCPHDHRDNQPREPSLRTCAVRESLQPAYISVEQYGYDTRRSRLRKKMLFSQRANGRVSFRSIAIHWSCFRLPSLILEDTCHRAWSKARAIDSSTTCWSGPSGSANTCALHFIRFWLFVFLRSLFLLTHAHDM